MLDQLTQTRHNRYLLRAEEISYPATHHYRADKHMTFESAIIQSKFMSNSKTDQDGKGIEVIIGQKHLSTQAHSRVSTLLLHARKRDELSRLKDCSLLTRSSNPCLP